jgi:SNF2 family DNA or RNA helicase
MAALRRIHNQRGTLLWIPMGGGKTRIAVDYIQNMLAGNTLILCPLRVIPVWRDQIARYWTAQPAPYVRALDTGTIAARAATASAPPARPHTITILNYETLASDLMTKTLAAIPWSRVILDECHRIKAAGGVQSRRAARLCSTAHKIIGLSGTPLSTGQRAGNRKIGAWLDIYGQARAIWPHLFPRTHAAFKAQYGRWMVTPFPKLLDDWNQDDFHARMNRLCYHITEDDLAISIPEPLDTTLPVTLPPAAAATYAELETEMIADTPEGAITAENILVKQLRLQQIAGGHIQLDGAPAPALLHTAKFDAIVDTMADIPDTDNVVIFARFRPEINELTHRIKQHRAVYHIIGGRDTSDAWKHDPGSALIVQINAGSEGIDLTAARYAIYCSLCHSLKDYQQSRKRLHRPGQTRTVTYINVVATGTIDETIMDALATKADVIEAVSERLRQRRTQ